MTTRIAPAPASDPAPSPWWKHSMMWLVVGGPLVVVVASFITLGLAIKHPDPVLDTSATQSNPAQMPAMQGRNHSATGGVK